MRYRMLALDLDGTLLDPHNRVSPASVDAIARAVEAGLLVVPCTGRGWRESTAALAPLIDREDHPLEVGVFNTGACVADLHTGRTYNLSLFEPHLAHQLVELLRPEPEAVLVFQDANATGHDYLVTGDGRVSDNTNWWFRFTGARVARQRHVEPADLRHTLRVGMVAPASRAAALAQTVQHTLGDRVLLHHFTAIKRPRPAEDVHVLEIFPAGVDKWRGLAWIADNRSIDHAHIIAIGDQVNDLSMLTHAALPIAMGNAIPQARQLARHVTHTNADDGVAHAIHRVLDGIW